MCLLGSPHSFEVLLLMQMQQYEWNRYIERKVPLAI